MSQYDYGRIVELCGVINEMDKHGSKFKAIRDDAYNELMAINDEVAEAATERNAPKAVVVTKPKGKAPVQKELEVEETETERRV